MIAALGLFAAGRARLAPALIDQDGIILASDSVAYRQDAIELAQHLQSGKIADWLTAARPTHVKLIAIPFAIFGPLIGYSTLSAEPYNILFYTTIVALVFMMGREVSSRRVGLLAGAVVAAYPSFLLHTLQLLKDPLVVAASLAFVLGVTTWLTRTYHARSAAIAAVLTMFMVMVLFFTRTDLVMVFFATALLGVTLLVVRQLMERRYLLWNMFLPLPILFVMIFLISSSHSDTRIKQFPADQVGPPKIDATTDLQIPSALRITSAAKSNTLLARWRKPADDLARRAGSMRLVFAGSYPDAGSFIDRNRQFRSFTDLLAYIPRAMEIGLWAPFPNAWISGGRRVGNAGNLLAGAETFFIYLFQVFAVWGLFCEPRRLALWFLLAIATLGVTTLAVVVPNIGALYRLRYALWMTVIVVAITVVDRLLRQNPGRSG